MNRAAPLVLLLLAACNAEPSSACPGAPVVSLAFTTVGGRTVAPLAAGLDPSPSVRDCGPDPSFPTTVTFSGTFAAVGDGSDAALCRKVGTNLAGTHSGDRWSVSAASAGAVLADCGASCNASSRVTVTGDLTPSGAAPTGFAGALVEVLSPLDPASCSSSCVLPCAGRYLLAATKGSP